MEIVGSFLDEEWESLSQMFSSGENPDFLLHCDSSSLFSSNVEIPSATFFPSDHAFEANFCSISQESSNTSEIDEALFLNIQGNEDQQQHFDVANDNNDNNNTFEFMNFHNDGNFMLPAFPDDVVMEEFPRLRGENRPLETADSCQEMQLKRRKSEDSSPQNPKKKPRFSRNAQKSRTAQSKKSKRTIQDKNNEEESNAGGNSCSSEEDSNASQELINGGTTAESNAKTRASRGSATDPQSLYARKRRERINERLKILQNLVPNGTKVDISTMLEEAVQYVKFLQLQIKLLSSDNLWMYAPLAYNGMDIGVYQNICPNLRL